jgi:hypothetical protein
MRSKFLNPSVNPTIDTDAYTANDVVGGLLSFDVSKTSTNGGIINQVILADEDAVAASLILYLFESAPTTFADDAAFAPVIADLNKIVAKIPISTYTTVNSLAFAIVDGINSIFVSTNSILYGYLVAVGTPNYTTADGITVRLQILSDQA